jgi:hypothetical protein
MPADYKYEHISTGRVKALEKANAEIHALYKDMVDSEMISPAVIERFKVSRMLVRRAAGGPLDCDEIALLEKMFGQNMGTEKQ